MGDRALIQFTDGQTFGPVVYLHSSGYRVGDLLQGAAPRMRAGDVSYATARFIGHCHAEIDGALSLGVWSQDGKETSSHGDAGTFIVDISTGEIETSGGYGFGDNVAPKLKFFQE